MGQKDTKTKAISPTRVKKIIQECSQAHLQVQSITASLSLDKQLRVDRPKLLNLLNDKLSVNLNSVDYYSCVTVEDLLSLTSSGDNNTKSQIIQPISTSASHNMVGIGELIEYEGDVIDNSNRFIEYRSKVISALKKYTSVKQKCGINDDEGLSYAIEKKARPFIKGFFTLAVVGKMSSGKSTFLNAIIGGNLLPTGWDQTTCALIEIIHSDKEYVDIDYFTDSGKKITKRIDSNIRESLQASVAVPEDYRGGFPVNAINRYILDGFDANTIVSFKDKLETVSKRKLSEDQIISYVKSHPVESIPQRVTVYTPLPKEFHGWRIVDTPGVEAVGGIENETREFLREVDANGNSNVDAIIFVHNARENAEDSSFATFVSDTCRSIPESVRDRLFLVVTNCMDKRFNRHKEQYILDLKQRFSDSDCALADDRVFLVDNILELLRKYVSTSNKKMEYHSLDSNEVPSDWSSDSWEEACDLVEQIGKAISKMPEFTNNNETYEKMIDRCSQFKDLNNSLNNFVVATRDSEFKDIISLIKDDLCSFRRRFKDEIKNLEEKTTNPINLKQRLEGELKDLEKTISQKQVDLKSLNQQYQPKQITERFKVPDDRYKNIKQMSDKSSITKEISDLLNEATQLRQTIFNEIKVKADEIIKDDVHIDIEKLLDEAKEESKDPTKPIYERNGVFAKVLRFLSGKRLFSAVKDYVINDKEWVRIYADKAINSFSEEQFKIKKNVNETIFNFKKGIKTSLNDIISDKTQKNNSLFANQATLDELNQSINTNESYVRNLDDTINII